MNNNNKKRANAGNTIEQEMLDAEEILVVSIMDIEEKYDSIIADCVLMKLAFDRLADIKDQGELHYLNDILVAIGRRLEDINISSIIALEKPGDEKDGR